jgi:hypothetical protein
MLRDTNGGGGEMNKEIVQHKKLFFSLSVFLLGIIGIATVYSLRLNYPPIRSDGVSYYLYLPAVFVYHDLSLHHLADRYYSGHMPDFIGGSIYLESSKWGRNDQYLIKCPMGEAILMIPFFALACFISFMMGMKITGFSFLFQYAAAVSGLFYVTIGLVLLWTVLEKRFKQNTILLVLAGILFGSPLFHYATYDSVFSHAYSFFLFSLFLYCVGHLYSKNSPRYFIIGGVVAGLIVITRLANSIWLLFGIFYGVNSIQDLIERFRFRKKHIKYFLFFLISFLGVVFLQMIYWKIITGSFVVNRFPDVHINFAKPEILNVLFSARKGLFFWSPVLLMVFPGLFYVRKGAKDFFIPILLFLPLNIYLISSWEIWWYGGSFGQRPFVDSLPLVAICLCSYYEGVKSIFARRFLIITIVFCMILSTWLMIKYWFGIIPFDGVTLKSFINTFFVLKKS